MGVEHGLYCVGCCWGLMIVLFSLGVMSLVWMGVIAGVIFAEKVFPYGERLTRLLAVAFVALGLWIAFSPGSVPGLTDPAKAGPSMGMTGPSVGTVDSPGWMRLRVSAIKFLWTRDSSQPFARSSSARASPRRLNGSVSPSLPSASRFVRSRSVWASSFSTARADASSRPRPGVASTGARSVCWLRSDSCSRTSPARPRARYAASSPWARLPARAALSSRFFSASSPRRTPR